MTRQEKLEAIADYFEWADADPLGHILTREASLAAYSERLELEELREFRAMVEEGVKESGVLEEN